MDNYIKHKNLEHIISQEDIHAVEQKYGVSFPKVLRDYYLENNGSSIELCEIEIGDDIYEIADILPLKYGDCSFEAVKDSIAQDGFISDELFPFASDQGGNFYFFDRDSGKVYVIFGDDIENPIFLCDTVEYFFNNLDISCDE